MEPTRLTPRIYRVGNGDDGFSCQHDAYAREQNTWHRPKAGVYRLSLLLTHHLHYTAQETSHGIIISLSGPQASSRYADLCIKTSKTGSNVDFTVISRIVIKDYSLK